MEKIRIGIVGYGNLGKGVEKAIAKNPDMTLTHVLSRRNSFKIASPNVKIVALDEAETITNEVDVLILCGGSATDLPVQTTNLAKNFNVVDSFDNHGQIPVHFERVDSAARAGDHVAVISVGWDPGMFSVNRLYGECVLPHGNHYTFWGKGVSQGHSDAIRRVEGVLDARQYTVPVESAIASVRRGENPSLTTREKHTRECFVVAREGADLDKIENDIKTMPAYFADYDTTVSFISMEELLEKHGGIPHGGFVIRSGETSDGCKHVIEYSLKLDSNPEFTSSVLVAYARAAYRLSQKQDFGAKTIFDIAPALLSIHDGAHLRSALL